MPFKIAKNYKSDVEAFVAANAPKTRKTFNCVTVRPSLLAKIVAFVQSARLV